MLPCHGGTVWIWAGRQGTGGSRASHPPPWPPWTLGPCTPLTPGRAARSQETAPWRNSSERLLKDGDRRRAGQAPLGRRAVVLLDPRGVPAHPPVAPYRGPDGREDGQM